MGAPGVKLPAGALEAAERQAGTMCDDDAPIQAEQAFDITEHYVVSFLRLNLYGDERYADVADIEGAIVRISSKEGVSRKIRAAYELPQEIDATTSEAKLENGVLTLKLAKLVPVDKSTELSIQ